MAPRRSPISPCLVIKPRCSGRWRRTATCWRLLDVLDGDGWRYRGCRRAGPGVVWAQRADTTGRAFARSAAGSAGLDTLVIDLDAHVLVCHSEKEQTAPTFKHTFGYHPLLAFCDNTGEFLAALLRPGNAGSNTAADHIAVLDTALEQVPTLTGTGTRSWSAPTAPGARRRSSPTFAASATPASAASSPSAGPSPAANTPPSRCCEPGTDRRGRHRGRAAPCSSMLSRYCVGPAALIKRHPHGKAYPVGRRT